MGNVTIHEDYTAKAVRKGEVIHFQFRDIDSSGMEGDMHVYSMDLDTADALIRQASTEVNNRVVPATVADMPKGPRSAP